MSSEDARRIGAAISYTEKADDTPVTDCRSEHVDVITQGMFSY